MTAAPLEYTPPARLGAPAASMILLHGLGADGNDLFPLAPALAGGRLRVICPSAPVRPVTLNGGMPMRAWYDIAGADLAHRQDRAGADESAAQIEALIAAEQARGTPPERVFLAGFSQGAAMALHVGLRHPRALAGIIALSGYLLFADALADEAAAANAATPIFMAHGLLDAVVLPQWARLSRDALQQNNHPLTYQEYDALPHSIADAEIADLNDWLLQRAPFAK